MAFSQNTTQEGTMADLAASSSSSSSSSSSPLVTGDEIEFNRIRPVGEDLAYKEIGDFSEDDLKELKAQWFEGDPVNKGRLQGIWNRHPSNPKNQQERPNGVQVQVPNWYVPAHSNDTRPKTLFKISNVDNMDLKLDAVLMSDSGSSAGLTIPARKARVLKLRPVPSEQGGKKHFKGAGNDSITKIMLEPQVLLTVHFIRTSGEQDKRSCRVSVWCHEDEYLALTATPQSLEENIPPIEAEEDPAVDTSEPSSDIVVDSAVSPVSPSNNTIIAQIELQGVSPIKHRSSEHPQDRATIGMDVLHDLGVHINCSGKVAKLEIEEEAYEYED